MEGEECARDSFWHLMYLLGMESRKVILFRICSGHIVYYCYEILSNDNVLVYTYIFRNISFTKDGKQEKGMKTVYCVGDGLKPLRDRALLEPAGC